jgi:hypothetical protein
MVKLWRRKMSHVKVNLLCIVLLPFKALGAANFTLGVMN